MWHSPASSPRGAGRNCAELLTTFPGTAFALWGVMKRLLPLALLALAFHLSGCAAVIPLLGAGAGMFADRQVDHILESTASKTFAAPLEEVRSAMLMRACRSTFMPD